MGETSKRHAVIVGGSLGGLLAANMLHRAGWTVSVWERCAEELSGRGAGIVTHRELFDALAQAGITIDDRLGVEVPARVTLDRHGAVIGEQPLRQVLTAWGRLYGLLRAALPDGTYHLAADLVEIHQDGASTTAVFRDGREARGDILVGADGIRSSVRQMVLPEVRPVYAGYVAWRGLVDEARLSPATHAALFERFGFCLPPREQMLGYPVAGAGDTVEPGKRRYNFVWYQPADEGGALKRLMTDDQGRHHPDGIPPFLISAAVIAEMRAHADRVLAPQFAEIVRLTEKPFFQPIYDVESSRLAFGRVVLLGDSAFVARPHCGMGVTKAAGDALALADALRDPGRPVPDALAAYERERVRFGSAIVAHARQLGAYMQAQLRTDEERANAERYRTPDAVMRETAVAPRLAA
ncbi:FAD binding domain-containing protein [Azospirillum canadense]|uniref:FAD binding domain-containing protein n=1 Tax=Azospirillum canadense TaxID=403962 RepID=UPI0022279871|nr:FAD binding domain-containing protein [Azospirillum canadense]MCW2238805.1 2-polyprenyl-6-methoxyphenol hydroxylase-like FAD-dependent oxidoreductase [Azospirillum canadense]